MLFFKYFGWNGNFFQTHLAAGLIHCINGLIGKGTICDITGRQLNASPQRFVCIAHMMVLLIALLQVMKDFKRFFGRSLLHEHFLEASV